MSAQTGAGYVPICVTRLKTFSPGSTKPIPPQAMSLPGYRLHPLKGWLKGFWSVRVRANWRIIFRFEGADAFDVELTDYH
jgi:plasmid maintenance system killer protein